MGCDGMRKKGLLVLIATTALILALMTPVMAFGNPPVPTDQKPNSTLKIYGETNAKDRWDYWWEPFTPASYPKDVVFFNPAIYMGNGISAHSNDSDEKVYLRLWYEPNGEYKGARKTHHYPTINLEYIYMLIDSQEKQPTYMTPGDTYFYFPTQEKSDQTGLGIWEYVVLTYVSGPSVGPYGKTVDGTIRIEPQAKVVLNSSESRQFMDHEFKLIGASMDGNYAIVEICYTGNYGHANASCKMQILERGKTYFAKRHNELYPNPRHPDTTWYIRYEFKTQEHQCVFTVGKELKRCDTFYVNGVRYDVTAIEVLDTDGDYIPDAAKYIAIRTKLPKGEGEVVDESVVSTQRICCVSNNETLPLLPPFNMPHAVVDDINVPLWVPLKEVGKFPEGDPNGRLGESYFPGGEKFVTMQCPPYQWLAYFAAVPAGAQPITTDQNWKPFLPPWCDYKNMSWRLDKCGYVLTWPEDVDKIPNTTAVDWTKDWIAFDVRDRIVDGIPALMIYYTEETIDKRFSTNLLEKLEQKVVGDGLKEVWYKFDIQTLPDLYTEIVLPPQKDLVVGFYANQVNYTIRLPGDYLVKTSLIANNSIQWRENTKGAMGGNIDNVSFWFDEQSGPILEIKNVDTGSTVNIINGSNDGVDIYVNADPYDRTKNVTVRIYGDVAPARAAKYPGWDSYDEVFNPAAIKKDSITFDPAIIRWDNMSAGSVDAYEKVYYRVFYEPCYPFFKNESPSVVTETTYLIIDEQDYQPLPAPEGESWFAFPVYANLSDGKALGLQGLELVKLEDVYVNDTKSIKGGIKISKDYLLSQGDEVQFMDHKVKYKYTEENGSIAVLEVCYVGNKDGAKYSDCKEVHLVKSQDYYFKRHNEYDTFANPWAAALAGYPFQIHYKFKTQEHDIVLTIGRVLMWGHVFYVDGVEYDIVAVETLYHNGKEAFKFITLRTPFPKEKVDESIIISSQWIEPIHANEPIPVLPPFNAVHDIVDDTDVVLWYPLKHLDKWPKGDPSGIIGKEYFPNAERYLTMQRPPHEWLKFFRAVPIMERGHEIVTDWQLWDNYGGPFYPPDNPCIDPVWKYWIACNVKMRIVENVDPLVYYYVNETTEYRYSTNLLELLNETVTYEEPPIESWAKLDIQTLPDLYTEFRLPIIPSIKPEAYVGGDFQRIYKPDTRDYPGSYIITTSFFAPNGKGNLNEDQDFNKTVRYAFALNASYGGGLYLNEDPVVEPTECGWVYHLKKGSNYVSMVAIPENNDPDVVFGTDSEVWAWDADTQDWDRPTSLEGAKGYIVIVPDDRDVYVTGRNVEGVTWATIKENLKEGWNLVGPGDTHVTIYGGDGMTTPEGQILAILGYDEVTESWKTLSPGDELLRGNAYWILVGSPPSP